MQGKVAICQTRPVLGDLERNFEAHHAWLDRAEKNAADLIVFPELSLTGYFLRDLVQDIALPLNDPRLVDFLARSKERSLVFGLVEESSDHRFYNSIVFAEGGEILHVHRKVHLPDYGIFEEGRYFAAGDSILPVQSRLGRIGVLTCEDAWHLGSSWLHFLQGADTLLIPCSSPARGVDTESPDLSSSEAWRLLIRSLALFHQSWVVHCNRVGFEDGAMFWGASSVVSPFGFPLQEASGDDEELLLCDLRDDPVRRARMFTPLLRDAKPDLVRRHLARLLQDPDALGKADSAES